MTSGASENAPDLLDVFAYGSNMHYGDLCRWLREKGHAFGGIRQMQAAGLPGYRLVWSYYSGARGGGAASIEATDGHWLPGVLIRTDAPTFAAIADKEGYPHRYERFAVTVFPLLQGQPDRRRPLSAWVYQVRPAFRKDETVPPTVGYLGLLLEAAASFGLPDWHIQDLKKIPTLS